MEVTEKSESSYYSLSYGDGLPQVTHHVVTMEKVTEWNPGKKPGGKKPGGKNVSGKKWKESLVERNPGLFWKRWKKAWCLFFKFDTHQD